VKTVINKEKCVNWSLKMSRLNKILEETIYNRKIVEADEEAPAETPADPEAAFEDDGAGGEDPGAGEAPVEGAEEANEEAGVEEEPEEETEETTDEEMPTDGEEEADEDFEDIDKTIEEMVGMTEIQHTSSSTIIDFEDGGQTMFVHPMVSMKTETLNEIIKLIIKDVKKSYAESKDEITGKNLNKTKYWKSVDTLIETMVKSQMTKSDNMNGLIDEIKQIFKVLEVK
jgi:hypothetical protein